MGEQINLTTLMESREGQTEHTAAVAKLQEVSHARLTASHIDETTRLPPPHLRLRLDTGWLTHRVPRCRVAGVCLASAAAPQRRPLDVRQPGKGAAQRRPDRRRRGGAVCRVRGARDP